MEAARLPADVSFNIKVNNIGSLPGLNKLPGRFNPPSPESFRDMADEKVGHNFPPLATEQGSGLTPRFIPLISLASKVMKQILTNCKARVMFMLIEFSVPSKESNNRLEFKWTFNSF